MDYELQIGLKIKSCRTDRGMTMKELAEQAQITPSMLSQIEKGQANPSLNTIRLLSKALDVPMFRFFMDEVSVENDVVRRDKRKHIIENGIDYEMLTPDMCGNLEMIKMTLKPGTASCKQPMSHIGEEIALILSGNVELILEHDSIILYTGDSVRIKSNIKHSWRNIGDSEMALVFAVSPPNF